MNINNFYWWLLILLNFTSYFTYSYGQIISRGKAVQFVGGVFFILSFVAMFIFFGLWSGIILILLAFALVAPIVGLLIARMEKRRESTESSNPLQSDEKDGRLLKALKKGMLEQYRQNHSELQENVRVKSPQQLAEDQKFLNALNKGMVNAHKDHAYLHSELKKYMSNVYITFFHHSDSFIEEFNPKDDIRPSFYWFGDQYYNHYSTTTRFKYFYLFAKIPKKDGITFRARHEGLGFNSLYSHYLKYKKERDQKIQKGIYNWSSPEPAILLSFSKIKPDLILEFEDERPNSAVVVKPEVYKGLKVTLFDNNNMPIQFTDIPEIVQILPKITHSFPFVEPKQDKGAYIYEDWLPMVTEQRSENLLRALNDGAMNNRKTY